VTFRHPAFYRQGGRAAHAIRTLTGFHRYFPFRKLVSPGIICQTRHPQRSAVEKELEPYKDIKNADKHSILPKIISTIQTYRSIRFGIGNRDIIQTGWEQSVSAAMRNHPNYKEAYGDHFDKYISSNSKIFSAFSSHHFANFGVLEDTDAFFLVLCINPHVKDEEKFHTDSKWEELINAEE